MQPLSLTQGAVFPVSTGETVAPSSPSSGWQGELSDSAQLWTMCVCTCVILDVQFHRHIHTYVYIPYLLFLVCVGGALAALHSWCIILGHLNSLSLSFLSCALRIPLAGNPQACCVQNQVAPTMWRSEDNAWHAVTLTFTFVFDVHQCLLEPTIFEEASH